MAVVKSIECGFIASGVASEEICESELSRCGEVTSGTKDVGWRRVLHRRGEVPLEGGPSSKCSFVGDRANSSVSTSNRLSRAIF